MPNEGAVLGPSVSTSRSQPDPSDPWKKAEKEIEDVSDRCYH